MSAQNVNQRVYLGSLDDFSIRHNLTSIRTVDDFNRFLTYAVLVGNPIFLNDGFLLSNGVLKEAMRKPGCSPFTALVDADFITIVSRNKGNPSELRKVMQQSGVVPVAGTPDEDDIVKNWWEARKNIADRKIAPQLWVPWPAKEMNVGFASLLREGLYIEKDRQTDRHDTFAITMFLEEFADDPRGNRTAAEEVAIRLRASQKVNQQQFAAIMYIANAAYDLNWAMCLETSFPGGIQCETLFSNVFDGYYEVQIGEINRRDQEVKIAMPDVSPKLFSSMNGLWTALADAGGQLKPQRTEFCRLRDKYFAGTVDARAVLTAAEEYNVAIKRHFGRFIPRRQKLMIKFARALTATSLDAWVFGAGELQSVLCTIASESMGFSLDHFLTKLFARSNTREYRLEGTTFGRNSIKGQGIVASANQKAVQGHLKSVPDR